MAREASTLSLATCRAGFSRCGIDPVGETSNVPDTPLGSRRLVFHHLHLRAGHIHARRLSESIEAVAIARQACGYAQRCGNNSSGIHWRRRGSGGGLRFIAYSHGKSSWGGVSTSGNGNSADGRDHWPYCYTAVIAGAGIKRGHIHGQSDKTGSAPLSDPVHPGELIATIYHAFGIDPATMVLNHLNQPRELVKAEAVTRLFG